MGYVNEWKFIKRNFETATGRKKPSEKFLGAFKRSSGVEPACRALDTALAGQDAKRALEAFEKFESARTDYQRTLSEATVGADSNLSAELKVMIGELELLARKVKAQVSALDDSSKQLESKLLGWKSIHKEVANTTVPSNIDVKNFTTQAMFTLSSANGQVDSDLTRFQAQAKQQFEDYKRALQTIANYRPDPKDFGASTKRFVELLRNAQDTLTLNAGGMMDSLGNWSGRQRRLIQGNATQERLFNQSVAWQAFNRVNLAISAENQRLGMLEMSFERQVLGTR